MSSSVCFLIAVTFMLLRTVNGRSDFGCASGEFECVVSQSCIPTSWKCDGEKDCSDGADETSCSAPVTCRPGYYKCKNGRCIEPSWVCDRHADCPDKDDEAPNQKCNRTTCKPNDFQCRNGDCIQGSFRCDSDEDCDDKSDEEGCPAFTCAASEFMCTNNKTCISNNLKCNGVEECPDGSDEQGCPSCHKQEQFTCANKECIPKGWHCDGDHDCIDHSDELDCPPPPTTATCSSDKFQCGNGDCIPQPWACDGHPDCSDKTDEIGCPTRTTCSSSQFTCTTSGKCILETSKCDGITDCSDGSDEARCGSTVSPCGEGLHRCGTTSLCINMTHVCNGQRDCPNGDDEAPNCGINECSDHKGHCHHTCNDLPIGYKCSCSQGYKLANDSRACVDVNECEETYGACSQTCTNNKGSYKCGCVDGYVEEVSLNTCKAVGPPSYLIFSDQHRIINLTVSRTKYDVIVADRKAPMAVSYDLEGGYVYWTDVLSEKIERARLQGDGSVETVVDKVKHSNGLAVDWVGKKLYWTDESVKRIEVSELDGKNRLELFRVSVDDPRGLAVDPFERYLFWSDWGSVHPKIERASMDGDSVSRQVILDTNIMWPTALTLDTILQRVYFVDSKLQKLETCKYDGSSRNTLMATGVLHPLGLSVFEDYLYYTDYSLNKILSVNKRTGRIHSEIATNLERPAGIDVVHSMKQKAAETQCGKNNGGCSHLCLLSRNVQKYSCRCLEGMTLRSDGKTCMHSGKPNQTSEVPPVSNKTITLPPVKTKTTEKLLKTSIHDAEPTVISTAKPTVKNETIVHQAVSKGSSRSNGMILGITLAVVMIIVAVVGIAIYLRKRSYSSGRAILFYKDSSSTPLQNDFDEDPMKGQDEIGSRSRVQFA